MSLVKNSKIFGYTDQNHGVILSHIDKRKEVYRIPSLGNLSSFETLDFSKDSHLVSFGTSEGII